ncbi:MAG: molybdenum cofactor biosynthesis protein MoaE [Candidatus Dormiibacterota bacterium]
MDTLAVRVLLFSTLRQQAHAAELELQVAPGGTISTCWDELCRLHPTLAPQRASVRPALNREYSGWDQLVASGDELAFLPPVSGGAPLARVRVGPEEIDVAAMQAEVGLRGMGAVATFVGVVRDPDEGRPVSHLTYEAYPEMAEAELARIAGEALRQEGVGEVLVHHRTGRVERGVASVAVVVSASHRHQALSACTQVIDHLKERAPIWKVAG